MRGLGTISNALAIVIGGVLGILFKRFLKERYQDTIIKATGFSVVFLGAAGTLSKILPVRPDGTLSPGGSMVMILSLALGALLGELIDLDAQFERFGEWLKHKTGSAARCHDGSCGSAVRLYDGRCAEQSLAGRKYSDFLCGQQSGVAKNHQGGKPAAVPSGCSGADGDFMNRNLTRSVIV